MNWEQYIQQRAASRLWWETWVPRIDGDSTYSKPQRIYAPGEPIDPLASDFEPAAPTPLPVGPGLPYVFEWENYWQPISVN